MMDQLVGYPGIKNLLSVHLKVTENTRIPQGRHVKIRGTVLQVQAPVLTTDAQSLVAVSAGHSHIGSKDLSSAQQDGVQVFVGDRSRKVDSKRLRFDVTQPC